VRGFLPGKLLGRVTALLSLALPVLFLAGVVDWMLEMRLGVSLRPCVAGCPLLIGLPSLAVTLGSIGMAGRTAAPKDAEPCDKAQRVLHGYFRIGPYPAPKPTGKSSTAPIARTKVLAWIAGLALPHR
jgi:hypothetical protein